MVGYRGGRGTAIEIMFDEATEEIDTPSAMELIQTDRIETMTARMMDDVIQSSSTLSSTMIDVIE